MFQGSTAHHQEVRYMHVANGTSKMPIIEIGWNGNQYMTLLWAGQSGDRIPVGGEIFHTRPDRPWGSSSLL
jgi:hypothetical protein